MTHLCEQQLAPCDLRPWHAAWGGRAGVVAAGPAWQGPSFTCAAALGLSPVHRRWPRCGRRIPAPAPCVTYSGTYGGLDVHVVWNGRDGEHGVDLVGTVPAAISSYLALQAFEPDLIISAGTAGGFKAQVGTLLGVAGGGGRALPRIASPGRPQAHAPGPRGRGRLH